MKAFIVYCHPSKDSFTKNMCDAFIKGITDSGNEFILSDLYEMGFDPVMLGDRLFGRVKESEFVVFDCTSRENELREKNWDTNLSKAYELGKTLFS